MKFFKTAMPLLLGFLLMAGSAMAQGQQQKNSAKADSITDKELKKFASVSVESQKIQKEIKGKIDSMLAEENMKMKRFQQIMASKRNPKMADTMSISKKEKETVKKIQPKLMKMSQESQKKMIGVIKDNGLTPGRFQQIIQAIRTQPEVMKRFQKIAKQGQKKQ